MNMFTPPSDLILGWTNNWGDLIIVLCIAVIMALFAWFKLGIGEDADLNGQDGDIHPGCAFSIIVFMCLIIEIMIFATVDFAWSIRRPF